MRPKKKWGQNFLRNKAAADKIVAAVEADPDELVLEIGPGEGALTSLLVDRYPGRVTAIEIDPELAASLRSRFGDALTVIEGDALEVPLPSRPFRAVGNHMFGIALGSRIGGGIFDRLGMQLFRDDIVTVTGTIRG